MSKPTIYETIWRNKWITSDAQSIDDMIGSLMRGIEELQEMKKDGIEGDFDGADDDYIFFRTDDSTKAKKYGMSEMEDLNDEEYEDLEGESNEEDATQKNS